MTSGSHPVLEHAQTTEQGRRPSRSGIVVALVLLLMVPAAMAAVSNEQVLVTKSIHDPIDWTTIEVDAEEDPTGAGIPETGSSGSSCSADFLSVEEGTLTFSEDDQGETGCVEAFIPLELPAGTTDFTVVFTADRLITENELAGASDTEPRAQQEVRVYQRGQPPEEVAYFDENLYLASPTQFAFGFDEVNSPQLAFWFADVGQASGPGGSTTIGSNYGLTSTISQAEVVYNGVPTEHTRSDLGTLGGEQSGIARAVTVTQVPGEDIVALLPRGTLLQAVTLDDAKGDAIAASDVVEDVSNAGITVTIMQPSSPRTVVITYSTTTASIQSTAVGVFGTATILMFVPLAAMAFIPLTKKRFNAEDDDE